jgi:hypothetical protein
VKAAVLISRVVLLLAFGFVGPIGPALTISVMLIAILTIHRCFGSFALNTCAKLADGYAFDASSIGRPKKCRRYP